MTSSFFSNKRILILIGGDLIVFVSVTIFGFTTHGSITSAGTRIFTTFLPLVLSWGLAIPISRVYDLNKALDARQLWRPFYTMVLISPFVAFLRSLMLGNLPILPIFVIVLGGISALALLAWRTIFWLIYK